jgi:hypothetical protein
VLSGGDQVVRQLLDGDPADGAPRLTAPAPDPDLGEAFEPKFALALVLGVAQVLVRVASVSLGTS